MAALKALKQGKGVGGAKVYLGVLERGGEIPMRNLHAVFQRLWKEEYMPQGWSERDNSAFAQGRG